MEVMEYQISIFTSNSYLSIKYLFYLNSHPVYYSTVINMDWCNQRVFVWKQKSECST